MPNISKQIALGLDIGGTKIKTVALEYPDRILDEHRIDSDAKNGPDAVRTAIHTAIRYYTEKEIPFSRIGIGCAGSVDPESGVVLNSPNFAAWKNVPMKEWVQSDFKLPVTVDNDANCATVTEWKMGNGRGHQNLILLTFGTGIGGGLILRGQLYTGSTGSAGELGHFSIHADGKDCACGNRGCFERYCSASALELRVPGFSAKEIFAKAAAGEEPFHAVLEEFFHNTKIGLTSIANIFDPDCILIGGGLSKGMAPYLGELQKWIEAHAFPSVAKRTKLILTQFANQSGAIGAALLSFNG